MKVGVSDYTFEKQQVFKGLARFLLRAAKGAIEKANRQWTHNTIHLFDINAGPGIYKDHIGQTIKGSPLILLELAEELGLDYQAYFIEKDEKIYNSLCKHVSSSNHHVKIELGDHCEKLPQLLYNGQDKRKRYGLLYTDPTGQIPPFELLKDISENPVYDRLDLVISISATNLKRVHGAGYIDKDLMGFLREIKKRYWLIREPMQKHQWSFLIGSNWVNLPQWTKAKFYRLNTPEGRRIMESLNKTKEERNEQQALPFVF